MISIVFSFFSNIDDKPIIAKADQVNINIDELPIIKSDTIIEVIGTIIANRNPTIIAVKTVTVVISSRFGAKL